MNSIFNMASNCSLCDSGNRHYVWPQFLFFFLSEWVRKRWRSWKWCLWTLLYRIMKKRNDDQIMKRTLMLLLSRQYCCLHPNQDMVWEDYLTKGYNQYVAVLLLKKYYETIWRTRNSYQCTGTYFGIYWMTTHTTKKGSHTAGGALFCIEYMEYYGLLLESWLSKNALINLINDTVHTLFYINDNNSFSSYIGGNWRCLNVYIYGQRHNISINKIKWR